MYLSDVQHDTRFRCLTTCTAALKVFVLYQIDGIRDDSGGESGDGRQDSVAPIKVNSTLFSLLSTVTLYCRDGMDL